VNKISPNFDTPFATSLEGVRLSKGSLHNVFRIHSALKV